MVLAEISLAVKILSAIKTLFGLKDSLAKADSSRRGAMAEKFEKVAACLEAAATEIRAGQYPAGRCAEMLTYAVELPPLVAADLNNKAKAQEIGDALKDAYAVEKIFAYRDQPQGKTDLAKLDEAAGLLRALATLVSPAASK
jgi:hypothetical protein